MNEVSYSPYELQNFGRAVITNEPQLVEKYKNTLEKPEPEIYHIVYLWPLRSHFCASLNVTIEELFESTDLRRKFIATAIKLFNPEYLTGYKNVVKDDLAEQMSVLLECNRTWISQQCKHIRAMLNPPNQNRGRAERLGETYCHERNEIETICAAVKIGIEGEKSRHSRSKAPQEQQLQLLQ